MPLLDSTGAPTGDTIRGAINVTLTADDLDAAQDRQLWIQGGTATDPLLYTAPVNSARRLGFGTVRCAVDNWNGDNVEWLGFPS